MSRRLGTVAALAAAVVTIHPAPASAAAQQISGRGVFDLTYTTCDRDPDYDSYPPIVISGSLEGCWYTHVDDSKYNGAPSGVYLESGRERFVAFNEVDSFTTTYKFQAKLDPATLSEIKGRCEHPIVAGSGTGRFTGVTGRLNFKDIVGPETTTYEYRGHLRLR